MSSDEEATKKRLDLAIKLMTTMKELNQDMRLKVEKLEQGMIALTEQLESTCDISSRAIDTQNMMIRDLGKKANQLDELRAIDASTEGGEYRPSCDHYAVIGPITKEQHNTMIGILRGKYDA